MPRLTIQQSFDSASRHHQAGRLAEAEQLYRLILTRQPDHVDSLHFLGVIAHQAGKSDIALPLIRRAIDLQPKNAQAQFNLGIILKDIGNFDEAIAAYRQAIALKPNIPDGQSNLAAALIQIGQLDEAIAVCRATIAADIHGGKSGDFTNLLLALYHHPASVSAQFLHEARRWARLQPVFSAADFSRRNRSPDRKLRIGYLSPFFVMSSEAHFIIPLLAQHDRTQFEIFCYSRNNRPDELSSRARSHCDRWVDISKFAARESVELIRGDEIDILVNISKPADECLEILASRVAPLQVNWLTFGPFTTGLETMDYRISDPVIDPVGIDEDSYSEKTLRLPDTAWCYDPLADPVAVESLPALGNGLVTFGSMNRFNKINASVISAWADILRSVPNSRLRVVAVAGNARLEFLNRVDQLGVDGSRIEFIDRSSRADYMKQYRRIDIMLDTFPYGGHSTVFDSLWMGVPVVTRADRTCLGRATASALHNLNLGEQ